VPSLPGRHDITVLVVDDDPSICRALKFQLETLGFKVLVFNSAESLLASEVPPDRTCLLADVYLPGMNGAELCSQLHAGGVEMPTILMSAHDDGRTRQFMSKAKPIASLFKPFDDTALLRALTKAVPRS